MATYWLNPILPELACRIARSWPNRDWYRAQVRCHAQGHGKFDGVAHDIEQVHSAATEGGWCHGTADGEGDATVVLSVWGMCGGVGLKNTKQTQHNLLRFQNFDHFEVSSVVFDCQFKTTTFNCVCREISRPTQTDLCCFLLLIDQFSLLTTCGTEEKIMQSLFWSWIVAHWFSSDNRMARKLSDYLHWSGTD